MIKRIPTHPGAVLREKVLPNLSGLNKSEFAEMLGVSRQTLYALLAERTKVTAEIALRLGTLLGNDSYFWIDLQTRFDMRQAQVKLHEDLKKLKPLRQFPEG